MVFKILYIYVYMSIIYYVRIYTQTLCVIFASLPILFVIEEGNGKHVLCSLALFSS